MISSQTCSFEQWAERYETLRAEAMQGERKAATGRGLVLFLRQGLAGWMAAWDRLAPTVPPRGTSRLAEGQEIRLRPDLGGQLAELLAGLILRRLQGGQQ